MSATGFAVVGAGKFGFAAGAEIELAAGFVFGAAPAMEFDVDVLAAAGFVAGALCAPEVLNCAAGLDAIPVFTG